MLWKYPLFPDIVYTNIYNAIVTFWLMQYDSIYNENLCRILSPFKMCNAYNNYQTSLTKFFYELLNTILTLQTYITKHFLNHLIFLSWYLQSFNTENQYMVIVCGAHILQGPQPFAFVFYRTMGATITRILKYENETLTYRLRKTKLILTRIHYNKFTLVTTSFFSTVSVWGATQSTNLVPALTTTANKYPIPNVHTNSGAHLHCQRKYNNIF